MSRTQEREDRIERSHRQALTVIEVERALRAGKTAKLRALRLEKESKVVSEKKTKRSSVEKKAMRMAEMTDVSPMQAKDLIRKLGSRKAEKEAKNFKAEG